MLLREGVVDLTAQLFRALVDLIEFDDHAFVMLVQVEHLFVAHCDGGSLVSPEVQQIVAVSLMTKTHCNIVVFPLGLIAVNVVEVIVVPEEVLHDDLLVSIGVTQEKHGIIERGVYG